jgi:NAD-dependent SIR2 family protein deacetylase
MSSAGVSRKIGTNQTPKMSIEIEQKIDQAAELVCNCDAILFTSGAGMSANSGLGTFRGSAATVWPPLLQHPDLDYTDIVNPDWFHKPQGNSSKHDTANFAYAFWTDRYNDYVSTHPHRGYSIVKQWSELNHIKFAYSFTSNIDGHWTKSGWNDSSVFECHGSIDYMQCVNNCCDHVWPTNENLKLEVDPKTNCAISALPVCPTCRELARPNVLMFNDWHFAGQRYNEKISLYDKFKTDVATAKAKLLIIELGAGTAVPSVRNESEYVFTDKRWTAHLIRINPFDVHSTIDTSIQQKSKGQALEITLDALTALTFIDKAIKSKRKH